jgi:copper chaperone
MNTIELRVEGMSCESCVKHVNEALMPLNGVQSVQIDVATGRVRVAGEADSAALIAALDEAGYPATVGAPATKKASSCCGGCCG